MGPSAEGLPINTFLIWTWPLLLQRHFKTDSHLFRYLFQLSICKESVALPDDKKGWDPHLCRFSWYCPFLSQQAQHTSGPVWPPPCHTFTISVLSHPKQFSSLSPQKSHSPLHVVSTSPPPLFFQGRGLGGIRGTPFLSSSLSPKSKLVSMRNWEECVSLTFFVECICTSCSSNLKQPTAFPNRKQPMTPFKWGSSVF